MKFAVVHLGYEEGPVHRALESVAWVRRALQDLTVTRVANLESLQSWLDRAISAAGDEFQLRHDPTRGRDADVTWEPTEIFAFIDSEMVGAEPLGAVFRDRFPAPIEANAWYPPAVLVYADQFDRSYRDRVVHWDGDQTLSGAFAYRVLSDLGYGADEPSFSRLRYALEGLFSTNWTRLTLRPSDDQAKTPGPRAKTDDRAKPPSRRLEPFDDHGPFLSLQIHDLSRILAMICLDESDRAAEGALLAFIADQAPAVRRGLDDDATLDSIFAEWVTTQDYRLRSRRLGEITRLYPKVGPNLHDDTIAYFDQTRFPEWLNPSTLELNDDAVLMRTVTELQKAIQQNERTWVIHWFRTAENYLRRLREHVIT